jgi:ubiquinone/menaquinone biosynthesis C-methylase UbiE
MPAIPLARLKDHLGLPTGRFVNHRLRMKEILKEVRQFPDGTKVLDVGCAGGDLAIEIAAAGHQVTAIDINPANVERARVLAFELGIEVSFEVGDATVLEGRGETYDLIVFGEILEHFHEPWKVLREVAPLCREGARLIATTPNMASLRARLKLLFLGMFADHNPEHLSYFTRRRFRDMLAKSPFEMQRSRTVVPMLIPSLGRVTVVDRLFWNLLNVFFRNLGENLLVVCRLRSD